MASPLEEDFASPTPPIWQGRARGGESAAILGRNPDGTFQVSLNGVEKTFTEPNLAGMLNMRKGPLYEMLGQATQQQLARPHNTTSTPPIWQGRARRGESAAILGRNPDGTFQVSLNGVEKTFTEPNLAAMLNMRKGPLYQMLGQITQQQLAQRRTTNTPPIWQGRAAGGETAAILGRNPDGTFQVSLNGVERRCRQRASRLQRVRNNTAIPASVDESEEVHSLITGLPSDLEWHPTNPQTPAIRPSTP